MMSILDNFGISPFIMSSSAVTDEEIYISAGNYNGLYSVDIASGELKLVGKFLHESNLGIYLFWVKRYGGKLVFVPENAHEIAFFDLDKEKIEEIPMKGAFNTNYVIIRTFMVIDGILYMFPGMSNSIILYEISSRRVLKAINIAECYKSAFGEEYLAFSETDSSCIHENNVYIPCCVHSAFMSFDLKSHKVEFHKIPEHEKGFCAFCGHGDVIYALCRDGVLIKWDIASKKAVSRFETLAGEDDADAYRKMAVIEGKIFLLSENTILKPIKIEPDMHTGGLRQEYLEVMEDACAGEKIYTGCLDGEKLYCYTDKNRYLCYDMKRERLEWIRDIKFDLDELRKIILDETGILARTGIIGETQGLGINELIKIICEKHRHAIEEIEESSIGKKIWEEMR